MTAKHPAKKLFIQTHGCQMNEYDSARMADLLRESHDLVSTNDAEEADILLLNTCSIREKAQEKVFHQLGRWRLLKERNPDLIIGVGGCVASQEGEAIAHRAPFVDIIFGPQTLHRLPEMIDVKKTRVSLTLKIFNLFLANLTFSNRLLLLHHNNYNFDPDFGFEKKNHHTHTDDYHILHNGKLLSSSCL